MRKDFSARTLRHSLERERERQSGDSRCLWRSVGLNHILDLDDPLAQNFMDADMAWAWFCGSTRNTLLVRERAK